jgi:hypothetical protein
MSQTQETKEVVITVHLDDGTYTGQLKNNKREGHGVYKWDNGDIYCGEYLDNKKSGRGTYTWANGDVYEVPSLSSFRLFSVQDLSLVNSFQMNYFLDANMKETHFSNRF